MQTHIRFALFPVVHWPYKRIHLAALANVPVNTIKYLDHSKIRLFLICGCLREICGNLRAFCGQHGYVFSAPHNCGPPLHVLTNLRTASSCLPLQSFLDSVKGHGRCNSVLFLGISRVLGFCGKKCYDFPNIQSKAETTFFLVLRRTKVQVCSFEFSGFPSWMEAVLTWRSWVFEVF